MLSVDALRRAEVERLLADRALAQDHDVDLARDLHAVVDAERDAHALALEVDRVDLSDGTPR